MDGQDILERMGPLDILDILAVTGCQELLEHLGSVEQQEVQGLLEPLARLDRQGRLGTLVSGRLGILVLLDRLARQDILESVEQMVEQGHRGILESAVHQERLERQEHLVRLDTLV